MVKYSTYVRSSKKYNSELSDSDNDNFDNCCFVLGFTSVILGISFFIGYIVYNYN